MFVDLNETGDAISRQPALNNQLAARREPSVPQRLYWADAAKAIAVTLVVLYHVAPTAMGWLVEGQSRGEVLIGGFSVALLPVRMPLFFMISGLLAVGALGRPWRLVVEKRVANLLWVFVIWTALYAFPYAASGDPRELPQTLMRALLWTVNLSGAYWFLPMLVLMFTAAKLTHRINPFVILSIALLLRIFAGQLPGTDGPFLSDLRTTAFRFATFFFWYCLGARGHALFPKFVSTAKWVWPFLIPIFGALTLYNRSDASTVDWTFLLSVIGILCLVGFSELITRTDIGRSLARYLASRTLPIYIFHALILVVLRASGFRLPELTSFELGLLTAALTIALTWVSCLLGDVLKARLPFLLRAPTSNS